MWHLYSQFLWACQPELPIWTSVSRIICSSYPGHNEFVARAGRAYPRGSRTRAARTRRPRRNGRIVRINDVGHAEAIDYRNYQYKRQEAENKYYLSRWATLYFSRNRYTLERDQTQSVISAIGSLAVESPIASPQHGVPQKLPGELRHRPAAVR